MQGRDWSPVAGAIVVNNDVTMSAPEGTVFRANSAGIEIRGSAQDNTVRNNRIRGRARAALAVVSQDGVPRNNTLVSNDLEEFQSSGPGVSVDAAALHTVVVERQAHVRHRQ